ncbi:hypothetical protein CCM_08555 [Cordyceps militaris CM01]|uniref:Uncharacterized protein n=1 Tax=Cordyceps militaris (strain CM01) TaxID=983644 RepID=G3JRG1_CORMM|nr:uncharacterized protein CCM_08555 [Cordyceps militaris CM01]EGX88511.1 hypothetical protein CCM_08555 [Cordyceps militaris CM01]
MNQKWTQAARRFGYSPKARHRFVALQSTNSNWEESVTKAKTKSRFSVVQRPGASGLCYYSSDEETVTTKSAASGQRVRRASLADGQGQPATGRAVARIGQFFVEGDGALQEARFWLLFFRASDITSSLGSTRDATIYPSLYNLGPLGAWRAQVAVVLSWDAITIAASIFAKTTQVPTTPA